MTRILIVFGNQTADEIVAAAQDARAQDFDSIRKFVYHDQIENDSDFAELLESKSEISYITGMIDVRLKPKVVEFATKMKMKPVSVVHPTAYVAASVVIGEGTFVAPQAVIAVNAKVGAHSIIHFHCSIGHDCQIGDYCAVLPGARISGNVTLNDCVMVGSGAFVYQGVNVGYRVQIDALTYVRDDVSAKRIVSCRAKKT